MVAQFSAATDGLRAMADFLEALNNATAATEVTISGSFTLQLPNDGDSIDARWDGEQYLIEDTVGG